jgi:hypothetical protein
VGGGVREDDRREQVPPPYQRLRAPWGSILISLPGKNEVGLIYPSPRGRWMDKITQFNPLIQKQDYFLEGFGHHTSATIPQAWIHALRICALAACLPLPCRGGAPPPSAHLVTFWREKKGSSTKNSKCRKLLKLYQIILSKLNAITCLTITSKWSVAMMEIFLSLDKYLALCKLKLLRAS